MPITVHTIAKAHLTRFGCGVGRKAAPKRWRPANLPSTVWLNTQTFISRAVKPRFTSGSKMKARPCSKRSSRW